MKTHLPKKLMQDIGYQLLSPLMSKLAVRNHKVVLSSKLGMSDDNLAHISHCDSRRVATIVLYHNLFSQDNFEILSTFVHELLHIHFHELREELAAFLDDELSPNNANKFNRIYAKREEYIVDDLSVCLTNAIPEDQKQVAYGLFDEMRAWYEEETNAEDHVESIEFTSELDPNESIILEKTEETEAEVVDSEEEISDNKEDSEEDSDLDEPEAEEKEIEKEFL